MFLILVGFSLTAVPSVLSQDFLPQTRPLRESGDLSAKMVAGIDKHLAVLTEQSVEARKGLWKRDLASAEAYAQSILPNREHLRAIIGAVDPRVTNTVLEYIETVNRPAILAQYENYKVYAVRWQVFENVTGEGLLLQPSKPASAKVLALPDADQTPEMLAGLAPGTPPEKQFARILAEAGCTVLVPLLIDRADTDSGSERLRRFTNQPHREWIYRQAYEMGRHIIGYEVQKVLAGLDALSRYGPSTAPLGLAGYSEGGLIALYSAALDPRVQSTLVSGYFNSRQNLWDEPIYRNVFGLLREFGDAEIATLIAPRKLVVEQSDVAEVAGPPAARQGRGGAAPGKIVSTDFNIAEGEFNRAKELAGNLASKFELISGNEGRSVGPGSHAALKAFLQGLGIANLTEGHPQKSAREPAVLRPDDSRRKRQVQELVEHTQNLLRSCESTRDQFLWQKLKTSSPADYEASIRALKDSFWTDTIGRLPAPTLPLNPQSKKSYDEAKWTGYDVTLELYPDVFAWGVLLLPKDIKPGERRPVVVCQHGLEGVPADTITLDPKASGYHYYKGFSARLAEQGFVVFAPHNPYRGHDAFRVLQRKANPLQLSLFSYIIAQHDRILQWLSEQPFVDPQRMGFYGLSYGGKTAMRVPAVLDRYALSICSGDFNEWVKKNTTVDLPLSYMFTGEYEMPEWNLGHTFNYAEMAALIAPRPFMVERGHDDGVGIDEMVAYEYAKVRRLYDRLNLGERSTIEFFNGPHTINGIATYEFLRKNLAWPASKESVK
ncbi:MAG TPA: prolyl oligopeptidase family serine peptidase [Candidatus Saccharimonadales bacterium]|nr:prolyl oligopeptidase family serine peptidase [Candidatus Saccharimonadales bacterium]